MSSHDQVHETVERIAPQLPGLPRLAIFEVVEDECERLRVATAPYLAPLVGPAALWRLRAGGDPAL